MRPKSPREYAKTLDKKYWKAEKHISAHFHNIIKHW